MLFQILFHEYSKCVIDFCTIDPSDPEFKSDEYLDLIKTVEKTLNKLPDLTVHNGFIYKKCLPDEGDYDPNPWKLWIPSKLSEVLIQKAHDPPQASHGGRQKTVHRLRQWYFWPGMVTQVKQYVNRCDICKKIWDFK